ncbi:MAG TPA: DUF5658 family protein [Gemmataceae bacterium]|jgi:hypothetical protein|nr:DUF5658 family protein [Gemmataceae bacterium]
MKHSTWAHLLRLGIFATLSIIDLALTYRLIRVGGGYIYESNPFANEWLQRFGWRGLAAYKIMAMALVAIIAIYVSVSRPRVGSRLLNFACLVVCVVVVYSFCMSRAVGEGFSEEIPTFGTPLCFDQNVAGFPDRERPGFAPAHASPLETGDECDDE